MENIPDFYSIVVPEGERATRRKELRAQYHSPVWTTQRGQMIPLKYMQDSHLRNCWYRVLGAGNRAIAASDSEPFLRYYDYMILFQMEFYRRDKIERPIPKTWGAYYEKLRPSRDFEDDGDWILP